MAAAVFDLAFVGVTVIGGITILAWLSSGGAGWRDHAAGSLPPEGVVCWDTVRSTAFGQSRLQRRCDLEAGFHYEVLLDGRRVIVRDRA
jgi:transposase